MEFKDQDHMTGQPPIPPSCSTLTLHLYLAKNKNQLSSLKSPTDIKTNHLSFTESFKEAKRRLQICSIRILDPELLTSMKDELCFAYEALLSNKPASTKYNTKQSDKRKIRSEHRTKRSERVELI